MKKLRTELNKAIDAREKELIETIKTLEESALSPVRQCEDEINYGISVTADILNKGWYLN